MILPAQPLLQLFAVSTERPHLPPYLKRVPPSRISQEICLD